MKISIVGQARVDQELTRVLQRTVADLAQLTMRTARQKTPRRTGRAQAAWQQQTTPRGFAVTNQIPYIERLEAGASRQAPRGIIGPTLTAIKGRTK